MKTGSLTFIGHSFTSTFHWIFKSPSAKNKQTDPKQQKSKSVTERDNLVRHAILVSFGFLNAFSFSVNVSELHVLCL